MYSRDSVVPRRHCITTGPGDCWPGRLGSEEVQFMTGGRLWVPHGGGGWEEAMSSPGHSHLVLHYICWEVMGILEVLLPSLWLRNDDYASYQWLTLKASQYSLCLCLMTIQVTKWLYSEVVENEENRLEAGNYTVRCRLSERLRARRECSEKWPISSERRAIDEPEAEPCGENSVWEEEMREAERNLLWWSDWSWPVGCWWWWDVTVVPGNL